MAAVVPKEKDAWQLRAKIALQRRKPETTSHPSSQVQSVETQLRTPARPLPFFLEKLAVGLAVAG